MILRLIGLLLLSGSSFALAPQVMQTTLEQTSRDLDLGLQGPGFYRVDVGNGEFRYTRDGRFEVNEHGELVTASGFKVTPSPSLGGKSLRISVAADGIVEVLSEGATRTSRRGQLLLVSFPHPEALGTLDDKLFWETEASGAATFFAPSLQKTIIRQGFREVTSAHDAALSGSVTITLPMESHSRGTEVELGEIAQVVGIHDALVRTVQEMELGYAPAPGYSRVFHADRILAALAIKLPLVEARFAGQKAVRVYPAVAQVGGAEIEAAARARLLTEYAGKEMSFELREPVMAVDIPEGSRSHEMNARISTEPNASGFLSVPVDLLVDGARYQTVWTNWSVTVFATRPVLSRRVRAGEVLNAGMFTRRRVEVKAGETHGLGVEVLNGAVALHDILPGQLVTALDVRRPVVIQLGESIFLRVRKGSIEAKVAAVALEAGAVGDRIRVRTDDGAQELVATINSRDICTIDLSN